jgi:hypothetical protein
MTTAHDARRLFILFLGGARLVSIVNNDTNRFYIVVPVITSQSTPPEVSYKQNSIPFLCDFDIFSI